MRYEKQTKTCMDRKTTQIVMGSIKSYEGLMKSAQTNKLYSWSCGKDTKEGDLLFFYFKKPKSEIVASATAKGVKELDKKWGYRISIKDVKRIEPPITLNQLREVFPNWGWQKRTRNLTYLDKSKAQILLELTNPKGKQTTKPSVKATFVGAGFGTPEQIRIAEQAACKAVRLHFENKGYKVVSREKDNLGYDFDVCRKGAELHVEVKGISGLRLRFPITVNEVDRAHSDSKFQLATVTGTNSRQQQVRVFSRNIFLKHFVLKPLAFFAEAKSSLCV